MPRRFRSLLTLVALACSVSCGGSGSNPDGPNASCFAIVGNKGTVTATITGLDPFTGIVPTGGAVMPNASTPSFSINSVNTKDGTAVALLAPVSIGAHPVGPVTLTTSITVQTRTCTGTVNQWFANAGQGSGTITVTSSSSTGVVGTFNGTVAASAGSVGTKTISGSFNATF